MMRRCYADVSTYILDLLTSVKCKLDAIRFAQFVLQLRGVVAQSGRAAVLQIESRGFESHLLHRKINFNPMWDGAVVAHMPHKHSVGGSNLSSPHL